MVKLNIDAHEKLCELYGRNWRQQHAQEGESGDRNRDMRIYALLVRYKAMQVRRVRQHVYSARRYISFPLPSYSCGTRMRTWA